MPGRPETCAQGQSKEFGSGDVFATAAASDSGRAGITAAGKS